MLYANELASAGKAAEAYQVYMNGVNMPKSYGEAKTWFNQEAHIFYYLGTLLESLGKTKEAANAFEEASVYKAAVSELSMFRALALRKLMRFSQAQQVLTEMLESGDNLLKNKDMRSYYGVGSPTPMPFEYDIVKINSVNGHILRGYALLGLGLQGRGGSRDRTGCRVQPQRFPYLRFPSGQEHFLIFNWNVAQKGGVLDVLPPLCYDSDINRNEECLCRRCPLCSSPPVLCAICAVNTVFMPTRPLTGNRLPMA